MGPRLRGDDSVMYYVYILASRRYGTLYIGVTNDLRRRMEEHRLGLGSEFVKSTASIVWSMSSRLKVRKMPFAGKNS